MFATGKTTVGLAEWIIDDTCLVCFVSLEFEMWEWTDGRTVEYSDHYRPSMAINDTLDQSIVRPVVIVILLW